MNILVKKNDRVEVEVYAWEEEGGLINASHLNSEVPKGKDALILKFDFRKPSYQDSQTIIKNSQINTNSGFSLDTILFQENVFRGLLVDWDIQDENGEKLAFTLANVNSLAPSIARAAAIGVLDKIQI